MIGLFINKTVKITSIKGFGRIVTVKCVFVEPDTRAFLVMSIVRHHRYLRLQEPLGNPSIPLNYLSSAPSRQRGVLTVDDERRA